MGYRIGLALTWLAFFAASLIVVYLYTVRRDASTGYLWVLPDQAPDLYKDVATHFAVPLGGILAGVFVNVALGRLAQPRATFAVALAATLLYLGYFVLYLAWPLFPNSPGTDVPRHVKNVVSASDALKFLVTAVNAYYFATKPSK